MKKSDQAKTNKRNADNMRSNDNKIKKQFGSKLNGK